MKQKYYADENRCRKIISSAKNQEIFPQNYLAFIREF
jgi:hypothetical protein